MAELIGMKLNFTAALLLSASTVSQAADPVEFARDVKPILEVHCLKCHGDERPKGDLNLTTRTEAMKGGEGGTAIVPGDPTESSLYTLTILPASHDDVMPPKKEGLLNKAQTEMLKAWIQEGAKWPTGETLTVVPKVNFAKDIQPILEFNCVACHRDRS